MAIGRAHTNDTILTFDLKNKHFAKLLEDQYIIPNMTAGVTCIKTLRRGRSTHPYYSEIRMLSISHKHGNSEPFG